jgi:hypothetical protein
MFRKNFRRFVSAIVVFVMASGISGVVASLAAGSSVCPPLAPPSETIIKVATVEQLQHAVTNATPGATILVAEGTYNLNGVFLVFNTPNVTLRSASGDRATVVLDGAYRSREIAQINASRVTLADLTMQRATKHVIHVMSTARGDTLNTRIYNVHIIDPGEQAIKINTASPGHYSDNGEIACSRIELTDAGRPRIQNNCYTGGIDAHKARGWLIRDNVIEEFWCPEGLAEHAVHFWDGSRDTVVERNVLKNNSRGVGFGMMDKGSTRTYPDDPCPAVQGYVDHYGGTIRNNFIFTCRKDLFAAQDGADCGICLWQSCQTRVLHNTIYSTDPARTFSSIEWRFGNTRAEIINNLVNIAMRERDGASANVSGNVTNAQAGWFVNAELGDLHLAETATSVIDRATSLADVTDDIDSACRPAGPTADVGAHEYGASSRCSQ